MKIYREETEYNVLELVKKEYQVLSNYENNQFESAVDLLSSNFINNSDISIDDQGWYLQLGAHITNSHNQSAANDMQIKAKQKNANLLIPAIPLLTKKTRSTTEQITNVKNWINQYDNATDFQITVRSILIKLVYSPKNNSNIFESGLLEIGEFLDMILQDSKMITMMDPIIFWATRDYSFVIECKNRTTNDKFSRDNAEQLLHSENWYNGSFISGPDVFCIAFHKSNVLFNNVHVNHNCYSVNDKMLEKFKSKILNFVNALSIKNPSDWTNTEIASLM